MSRPERSPALGRLFACFQIELRYNLRRSSLWILVGILALVAVQIARGEGRLDAGAATVGGGGLITSEFGVAKLLAILVPVVYSFFFVVFAGTALIRDDEHRVGELLHATSLRPVEYVWGKYLAVLATALVALVAHLAVMVVAHHLLPSPAAGRLLGPFHLASYLRPALLFAIPLLVVVTGVSFALGERVRSQTAVFMLPVVILPAWIWIISWSPGWLDPRIDRLLMLVDASGLRWLLGTWFKVDRGAAFYDLTPIGYDASFLLSRAACIAVGLGAVAWSARHARRTSRGAGAARVGRSLVAARGGGAGGIHGILSASLASLGMRSAVPGLGMALHVAATELKELRSQASLYLFVPLIVVQTIGSGMKDLGAFDTLLIRTPGTLAVKALTPLTILGCLLLLVNVVESMQRERRAHFEAIFRATSVSNAAIVLGKGLANLVIAAAFVALTCFAGVVALLIQGRVVVSLVPFAVTWIGLLFPTYALWISFILLVEAVGQNRYASYACCILALLVTTYFHVTGSINWLGNWNVLYAVRWSDFGAFEIDSAALVLSRLFALAVAALLLRVAIAAYPRRVGAAARWRAWLLSPRSLRAARNLAPYLVLPIALGSVLGVSIRRGYQGGPARQAERAYRTQNRAAWKGAALPALRHVELDVELEPARRELNVSGHYDLSNLGGAPLVAIPLTIGHHFRDVRWTIDGAEATADDHAGLTILRPATPLPPNGAVRIGFRYHGALPEGISRNGGETDEFVLSCGTHLHSFYRPSFVPLLGFRDDIGLEDGEAPDDDAAPASPTLSVIAGAPSPFSTRIRITGPAEYAYNSVGVALSDEVHGDRRTVVWESDHPVSMFNIIAGRWAKRARDGSTIFFHPEHGFNVDQMLDAMVDGRRLYSAWFGAYPWRELRLSEFPDLARFAQGTATNIAFSEGHGFLSKAEVGSNPAFWITAHEVAHQWWGNQVVPRPGPGSEVLVEGMAHFSAMMLVEETRGPAERMEFARRIEERYTGSRSLDAERPLVEVTGARPVDRTVAYDRGSWALWMLAEDLGRERALAGLRDFVTEYAEKPIHPMLEDLLRLFRAHAPDPARFDELARQWFRTTALPELKLTDIERRLDPGARPDHVLVTARIQNAGTGRFTVTVAATVGERFVDGRPAPDYREVRTSVVLGPGESQPVSLLCPFAPAQLVVDPDVQLLQINRKDAAVRF